MDNMRIDKKIGKNNVLVHFNDECNNFYIRESGKENRLKYDKLLTLDDNKIKISKDILKKYGIKIEEE